MAVLPIIIKADVSGSLEAIVYEIGKLNKERIVPQIISAGVGEIGENDIRSALTTPNTVIMAFHTKIDPKATALAERSDINVETFDVIYKLTERIADLLNEREPRIEVEEVSGTAKTLKIFSVVKDKQVLGARVVSGIFKIDEQVRIIRREVEIGYGKVKELQQNKIKVENVGEGHEFGVMIESKTEIAPGDMLEQIIKVTK